MYHIIVNPASRTGKGEQVWNLVQQELKIQKKEYMVYFTLGSTDATKFAEEITSSLTETLTLVVLGGDGTMNEVIQGIKNHELVRIGYIPTGSSNDLARDLGLAIDPLKALSTVLNPSGLAICDVGQVTYLQAAERLSGRTVTPETSERRLFAVGCGIGFDAAVCEEALHSKLKNVLNHLKLGKLTYLAIALKQIIGAPKAACTIIPDQGNPITLPRFLFIASMIHRYEGGGFQFCPDADASDGLLDICVAGNISIPKILYILPHAFGGSHLKYRGIMSLRTRQLRITSTLPLWVHTDGEVSFKASDILLTNTDTRLHFII